MEDPAQELFALLLEKDWLKQMQPEKGQFRSLRIAALNHFPSNEWDKQRRLKRGSGLTAPPREVFRLHIRPGSPEIPGA